MEGRATMTEVKFKRVDGNKDLSIPAYATPGAAGMDLRAFLPDGPVTFEQGQIKLISTGFSVELPPGTEMQIRPRSGLALKHGFMIPNSPGTVDEDYRGTVMVGLYYIGGEPCTIQHGDRIAQAVIADVRRCVPVEVAELSDTERGSKGFGSTGTS
jgi:dUTP pyrophosphatase